jgi:uncharacterized protein (DUF1800 family)
MDLITAQALVRFGLGRRASEPLPNDPPSWLAAQLRGPDPALTRSVARPGSDSGMEPEMGMNGEMPGAGKFPVVMAGAIDTAAGTTAPFRERLVWFWLNHFTVSTRKAECGVHIPAFVSEAIRPHVTGRFGDMLLAVMRSPAMLIYLDNRVSIGPHSPEGEHSHKGLNENLARECLELYTVSPAAGYTQADVISFSRILTGWSVRARQEGGLEFGFKPGWHEPGAHSLMGRSFPPGEEGGIQALAFIADHPATHRHIATRLVRHFVADDPPPDAVRRIEGVLRDTRGDLRAASEALIHLEGAWQPGTKLRTPIEFAIAALRALEQPFPPQALRLLNQLGQPIWGAPQPNGWPDQAVDWVAPEAMIRRVDFAYGIAGEKEIGAPDELAQATLGPLLRPATLQAVRRAGSRREGVALLFSSPEFQRR